MKLNSKSKKAQLTMFIVLALIIIVLIAIIFWIVKKPQLNISSDYSKFQVEECIKDSLEKQEKKLLENNGYTNITNNFIVYYGEKVPYLCKSSQFYIPCINQEPLLIEKIRGEMQESLKKDVSGCISQFVDGLKKRNDAVEEGPLSVNIVFKSGSITGEINKRIVTKKGEATNVYENFANAIPSPLFDLVKTSQRIVDFESTLCDFNDINWMMYYREIKISKFVTSDQTKIYTLKDRISGKEINFAVKTCVLPAGI